MSGINLLLSSAIDYERTHQIALYTLLTQSHFPRTWLGISKECQIEWEPEKQLFDLLVSTSNSKIYIELKMGTTLGDSQFRRQLDFLKKNHSKAIYILLGTSWFEYSTGRIEQSSKDLACKVGYQELLDALNKFLVELNQPPDVYEFALAYRNTLQTHFDKLTSAALKSSEKDKPFYYSLFWMLQQRLSNIVTDIYTVTNPGGPVYILNDSASHKITLKGVAVYLYSEIVNNRLCIKFYTDADDDKKTTIRKRLREACHLVLDNQFTVIDSGRLGRYMTACQIDIDPSDISKLDYTANVFSEIHDKLSNIAQRLSGK
jgi:hypothetical protein